MIEEACNMFTCCWENSSFLGSIQYVDCVDYLSYNGLEYWGGMEQDIYACKQNLAISWLLFCHEMYYETVNLEVARLVIAWVTSQLLLVQLNGVLV